MKTQQKLTKKLRRAYGEHALTRTQVFRWHKAFLDGRESVEDEPRCGRSCTSKTDENVTKVRDLMRSERHLSGNDQQCVEFESPKRPRLRKRVHHVWPEIADTWMLHHDNAPYHIAISVNEFSAKKRYFSGSAATILA